MKYAKEINITVERLVEIASMALDGLICDDEDSAMEYFADAIELTREECELLGVDYEEMETHSKYYEELEK